MSTILATLLTYLLLYKYVALFVVIFLSAIIVPFPANTLLLATGAFASQGYFSFTLSLLVTLVANVLGDLVDYFLSRRYNEEVLFRAFHIKVPTYFDRLKRSIIKYPGPAIFLSRFIGTIGSITNLLCGFIGISFGTFLFFDVLGNLISDGAVLCAGYFFGIHWQDFTGFFSITDYMLIGIVVAIIILVMMRRKRKGV